MAEFACGAVSVVCRRFNYDGNTGGTVALVGYLFIFHGVRTRSLLNDTVDVIVGNIVAFCLCDKVAQLAV